MAEYIEREAVLAEADYDGNFVRVVPAKKIRNIPAADVVEVVRCKDCKHGKYWNNKSGISGFDCDLLHMALSPEAFCYYGERRESNG